MSVYSIYITLYAIALFTPTIINELGYSAANAQLLSTPPFVCGSIFAVFVNIYSDRVNLRGPFVIAGAMVSLVGYIVAYTTSRPGPGYVASIITACGAIPLLSLSMAWAGGNSGGNMKRGVVMSMVPAIGNLGGYVLILVRRGVGAHALTTRTIATTLQYLFFVYLLPATALSQGPRYCDRLPWYEVCTCPSTGGRTGISCCAGQYRMLLRSDVDVQEAE